MMADNHSVDTDIDEGDYNEIQVHSALSVISCANLPPMHTHSHTHTHTYDHMFTYTHVH